jgi:hypothetical protein
VQLSDADERCHASDDSDQSSYRSWVIPRSGATVYAPRHRAEWLAKIPQAGPSAGRTVVSATGSTATGAPRSATRPAARESQTSGRKVTRQIPSIGPIRAALLVALLQTPHRFRTKRQLWAYSGFAIEIFSASGRERSFFLDIPFIELIDPRAMGFMLQELRRPPPLRRGSGAEHDYSLHEVP